MFSIKFHCGPADEYYMYNAYSYSVQGCKNDGLITSINKADKVCISVWPNKGDEPFDIFVESGQTVFVMNANGQTVDIIRGPNKTLYKKGQVEILER